MSVLMLYIFVPNYVMNEAYLVRVCFYFVCFFSVHA